MKRAVIVVGLGFGDEGKGCCTDYLTRQLGADLVVRYCGGAQAGHNVQLPDGRRHTFSQFGAGTLAGAKTYLSQYMAVSLPALREEANSLRENFEIQDPLRLVTIHPEALLTTPYHVAMNRVLVALRQHRDGSCGRGVGETRQYWLRHGRDALTVRDLADTGATVAKLCLIRERMLTRLQRYMSRILADEALIEHADALLSNTVTPQAIAAEFQAVWRAVGMSVMPACETVIFEGSQGALLDEWYGFHPHTTWSTVTAQNAVELLTPYADTCEVCTVGVTRSYATRHGDGPFPSKLVDQLTDPGNPDNPWQGTLRTGALDYVLLRYASQVIGTRLDALAVSCLDQTPRPSIVRTYRQAGCLDMQRLNVSEFGPDLRHQTALTEVLSHVVPLFDNVSQLEMLRELPGIVNAPVCLHGRGPAARDWQLQQPLPFRKLFP